MFACSFLPSLYLFPFIQLFLAHCLCGMKRFPMQHFRTSVADIEDALATSRSQQLTSPYSSTSKRKESLSQRFLIFRDVSTARCCVALLIRCPINLSNYLSINLSSHLQRAEEHFLPFPAAHLQRVASDRRSECAHRHQWHCQGWCLVDGWQSSSFLLLFLVGPRHCQEDPPSGSHHCGGRKQQRLPLHASLSTRVLHIHRYKASPSPPPLTSFHSSSSCMVE